MRYRPVSLAQPDQTRGARAGAGPLVRGAARDRRTDLAFLALVGAFFSASYFDRIYLGPVPQTEDRDSRPHRPVSDHRARAVHRAPRPEHRLRILAQLERVAHRRTALSVFPSRGGLPGAAAWSRAVRAPAPLWKTAGIFLGFFWVVALFEEFVFRGVLQQWLEEWKWSRAVSLLIASAVFGFAHLWFTGGGHRFPNWRWALIATALGWFCGHARNQAGSIRAGVVTHALVVATWREFFVCGGMAQGTSSRIRSDGE